MTAYVRVYLELGDPIKVDVHPSSHTPDGQVGVVLIGDVLHGMSIAGGTGAEFRRLAAAAHEAADQMDRLARLRSASTIDDPIQSELPDEATS